MKIMPEEERAKFKNNEHSALFCDKHLQLIIGKFLESRCALRLQYVDLVVNIKAAIEVCCCSLYSVVKPAEVQYW
jgi:hypothetical protein